MGSRESSFWSRDILFPLEWRRKVGEPFRNSTKMPDRLVLSSFFAVAAAQPCECLVVEPPFSDPVTQKSLWAKP
jgi:hypothetical protein